MKIFEILMLILGVMIIVTFGSVCRGWIEIIMVIAVGAIIGLGIPEFIKWIWKKIRR